ncbi:T9SS type B sorting domain-containing protein [Croceivirga thetidis]|uniref:T9SS type B sorting domain-containing protein n=1 Tax=Croceivirga thetidis TaxID=2721623 RepID=A0ABX1GT23_9FLAO|nr:T9SS type B sorting domain-containing protein [Croceivirga thetidis]NKI33088.1 T9SS type B sorting domain-containing protein [Croceivirga thetidis]
MRTLLFMSCACLLLYAKSSAQSSGDCRTAVPVCADGPIQSSVDDLGDIEDFDPDVIRQSGCLERGQLGPGGIEHNTAWYVFRAGTDGQIGFDLEALPVNPGDLVFSDLDFALYGPFDQLSGENFCTTIGDGTIQPIRCNYEYNTSNFTGLGVNPVTGQQGGINVPGSQNTYDEFIDVLAGEIYYLFINNYNDNPNGDPEPFTLTFTGSSVNANQDTALDCTLRDEFLGLDIIACEGDPDIVLSALNTPLGADIANVIWTVDYDDDGTIDDTLTGEGPFGAQLTVTSPNSGRYFVEVIPSSGFNNPVSDDILITFYGIPVVEPDDIIVIDDFLNSDQTDPYNIRFELDGDGDYEYAINGGEFQDDPTFLDVPPGINTVIVNDKNGCGTTEPIEFLVVGYPKFFTPNGDGIHDFWQILGIEELTEPSVFIFDRYGKLLKQLNQNSTGWDGTFNGRDLPSSDYWFKLDYERDEQTVLVARTVRRHFTLKR